MSAAQLLLWRHGRTASNAGARFQGQLDVPLDDVGRAQAKHAAEALATRIGTATCRIVCSDLSRARDTAAALAARLDLPLSTDAALREVFVGQWQGLRQQEVRERDPDAFAAWQSGQDIRVGAGERRSEAAARAEAAIRAHAERQDGGVLVVVSHGAALRGAILGLIGLQEWSPGLLGSLRNAHWASLDRRGDGWVLTGYNIGPLALADELTGSPRLART